MFVTHFHSMKLLVLVTICVVYVFTEKLYLLSLLDVQDYLALCWPNTQKEKWLYMVTRIEEEEETEFSLLCLEELVN